ncbi:MAG TPA: hypothetical protein VME18_04080 [Acidobacteriaceae bacterium]|nr:hypothetical protein [Acidobacteriaceae bacterium]
MADEMKKNGEVEDASAVAYYQARSAATGRPAQLLKPEAARNSAS